MGIWSAVKSALNSTMGTTGFMSLDKLISDKIASAQTAITANGGVKCVKNVQRGTVSGSVSGTGNYVLTVSAVNMAKSILLYKDTVGQQDYYYLANNDNDYRVGYAKLASSTTIEFTTNYYRGSSYTNNAYYEWQLIEFY